MALSSLRSLCTIDTRWLVGMVEASRFVDGDHVGVVALVGDEVPALTPASDLALDEAVGATELGEVTRCRVDGVEFAHGVGQGQTDAAADVGVVAHGLGDHAADDLASCGVP